jgi:hypothetical protein
MSDVSPHVDAVLLSLDMYVSEFMDPSLLQILLQLHEFVNLFLS